MADILYPGTAIILAGGKSSRMGFDKQLLTCGGRLVRDMLQERLGQIFQELIVVSNTPELYAGRSCRTIRDTYMGMGPLGGLHAGLSAASHQVCYLTACDMPWITGMYIRYLLDCNRYHPEAEAITTVRGNRLEPMNSIYCKSLVPAIEKMLEQGNRKMISLLEAARIHCVPEDIALRYSPDWKMFDNVNTPEDWERLRIQECDGSKTRIYSGGVHK